MDRLNPLLQWRIASSLLARLCSHLIQFRASQTEGIFSFLSADLTKT